MGRALKHIILFVWLFSFSVSCFGISVCEHSCTSSGATSTSMGAFVSADAFAENCCSDKAEAAKMQDDCCSDKDQYFKLDVIKKHDDEFSQKLVRVPVISLLTSDVIAFNSNSEILLPTANSPADPSGRQLLNLVQVYRI